MFRLHHSAHWAYVSGNSRLSCSMCVLASGADIQNGARHNLATWLELALMETQSGWSFQQGKWLSELDIDPLERLRAAENLFAVLYELELMKRWGALFAIALLRETPIVVIALWQEVAHIGITVALGNERDGNIRTPATLQTLSPNFKGQPSLLLSDDVAGTR